MTTAAVAGPTPLLRTFRKTSPSYPPPQKEIPRFPEEFANRDCLLAEACGSRIYSEVDRTFGNSAPLSASEVVLSAKRRSIHQRRQLRLLHLNTLSPHPVALRMHRPIGVSAATTRISRHCLMD